MDEEEEWPEAWDRNKVYMYTDPTGIKVPVPYGFTVSGADSEKYVTGNVEVKGTLSHLTFTSTGDYPWTQNDDNIWVSGNKGKANSVSELVSNEITVGPNGGWVEIEWSVCSELYNDTLSMTITDITSGTSEQIPKIISGTLYGTVESSLIYTKCGTELSQGKYTISIKYNKNASIDRNLDCGYINIGTFLNYNETGLDKKRIHKSGGLVIYEGIGEVTNNNVWNESMYRNQFVFIPVADPGRIYEKNNTTGKIKAKLWSSTATERGYIVNASTDTKKEPGVLSHYMYDLKKQFAENNMQGYEKYALYKELETEYKKTIESIEKYGGFYIGRYETGNISSNIPAINRNNSDISRQSWYTMYIRQKNISSNPNIQINMIWGSLFDETLEWLIETEDKLRVEILYSYNWGNYKGTYIQSTGSNERYKANNIYDLAGNALDWTLEFYGQYSRCARGGRVGTSSTLSLVSANLRDSSYVTWSNTISDCGTRAYLYIK